GHRRTVIYDFCPQAECADGSTPLSTVIGPFPDGSLAGVTARGGSSIYGKDGGVVYKLQPLPDGSWTETVIKDLCPFWQRCDRYGHPTSIYFEPPDTIEGLNQSDDGKVGLWWSFRMLAEEGQSEFTAGQSWTHHPKEGGG